MERLKNTYLGSKIDSFFAKNGEMFKAPLSKMIEKMLTICTYKNGESLERHNWNQRPLKLKYIPKDLSSSSNFEEELFNALDLNEEKPIIELLWGKVQLGKRVHACIIMWFSVYILNRPVLYIFRCLLEDQKQLQNDILGTEKFNFNIQFIKTVFDEFVSDIQKSLEEENADFYKDFKLPDLKPLDSDNLNKLSSKGSLNPKDIFCCLMHYKHLDNIDKKFTEYLLKNEELINITLLVDESDLMAPTSINDDSKPHKKDAAKCEILLAKIYKKVKYVLHITGTAHSLLYNVTTKLTDNIKIQLKISQVHCMKLSNDYYGLFNNKINFETDLITNWWKENGNKYDIIEDYKINIKKIIEIINSRKTYSYSSFLISPEKIRENHFALLNEIIQDFSDLFIIIYHGECLKFYFPTKLEDDIIHFAKWDENHSDTNRLWREGGINKKPIKFNNNYSYYDIDSKKFNIKLVYKLLKILFVKSQIDIPFKTVITISGRYAERGISFTSDDYDEFSFHLTDQYLISRSDFNCTNIDQSLRIQGKKNDNCKLTLWSTLDLKEVLLNFYVPFISKIEEEIMNCKNWFEIKNLIESIIDWGNFNLLDNMKYLDTRKKGRNLCIKKHYDKSLKSIKLLQFTNKSEDELKKYCIENNLPNYNCVNDIIDIPEDDIEIYKNKFPIYQQNLEIFDDIVIKKCKTQDEGKEFYKKFLKEKLKGNGPSYIKNINEYGFYEAIIKSVKKVWSCKEILNESKQGLQKEAKNFRWHPCYEDINKQDTLQWWLIFKKELISNNQNLNELYYINDENLTYKKSQVIQDYSTLQTYYWKSPDGWLHLYDEDDSKSSSSIVIRNPDQDVEIKIENEKIKNLDVVVDVKNFKEQCIIFTDQKNLRTGIKTIYEKYVNWCKINNKIRLKQSQFKNELEKLNLKVEKSKGVDINNKGSKRGYNIALLD
jgi:hypothetical protein